eukprot:EG_transcript_524
MAAEHGHGDGVPPCGQPELGEARFWAAVEEGNADALQGLLREGAAVDQTNAGGAAALSVAAERGHVGAVALLLKEGADVHHLDAEGHPALIRAAQNGHLAVVRLLLASVPDDAAERPPLGAAEAGDLEAVLRLVCAKAAVDRASFGGRTPLYAACENGHLAVAVLLVGVGAAVNHNDNFGRTPLNVAATNGHTEVVQLLLSAQAAVDYADKSGCTPLSAACQNGHLPVATLLVGAGAELDRADERCRTPLHVVAKFRYTELAQLLVSAQASVDQKDNIGRTPLHIAAQNVHPEMVKLLLTAQGARAAIDNTDEEGSTPLHIAVENHSLAMAHLLVSAVALVDHTDSNGRTPLHIAAWRGDSEMAQLLLSAQGARAALDKADEGGRTPLHNAAEWGNLAVAQLLVLAQASVDRADSKGRTPLHIAAQKGNAEMAQLLLSAQGGRTAMDTTDTGGRTPLFVTCREGHPATAAVLVGAGAAVDRATTDGCPPLYVAAQNGHAAVVRLLVEAGAVVNRTMPNGWTPLHIAAHNGHTEVVQLLASGQPLDGEGPPPPLPPPGPPPMVDTAAQAIFEPPPPVVPYPSCPRPAAPLPWAPADAEDQEEGFLPLYFACWHGNLTVATLLVGAGATVDEADKSGRTPLYATAHNGHTQVAQLLVSARAAVDEPDEDGGTPLWVAAFYGHLAMAAFLVESQADVNHPNKDGSTPLLAAAQEGRHLTVEWLLTVGADHKVVDNKGCSPLWAAVKFQHPDCVGALLKAKVDANFRNSLNGRTVLMCAAATGDKATIDLLQANGANGAEAVRDGGGFTTFFHADYTVEDRFAPPRLEELLQCCGQTGDKQEGQNRPLQSLEEVLRDPTVNLNAGDKYLHWTPLMEAVLFGDEQAVRCLVAHGAASSVRMFCGLTAAFWAALRGNPAVQAALGAGAALSPAEAAGLAAVRSVSQQSQATKELLAFDKGCGSTGRRRWAARYERSADLSVQLRMAEVSTDTHAGQFYPHGYQCPISLCCFLTSLVQKCQGVGTPTKQTEGPGNNAPPSPTDMTAEEVATLSHMVLEGRKMVVVHVAAPDGDLRPEERDCPPVDVFALFCYTYESAAYQRSNWAMRNWDRPEAQAALELWRPFIYHCERALQRLPPLETVVYRGIPISFEDQYGLGRSFVWQSFSSTSEMLKVAMNFALSRPKALVFVVKGRSGVPIRHCSHYPAEAEILFPPNLRLAVKWLGRESVLGVTETLRELPRWVGNPGYAYLLEPHQLTAEDAKAANVVVLYCEEEATTGETEAEVKEEGTKGDERGSEAGGWKK